MGEVFAMQKLLTVFKAFHSFSTKNVGVFEILTSEILTIR